MLGQNEEKQVKSLGISWCAAYSRRSTFQRPSQMEPFQIPRSPAFGARYVALPGPVSLVNVSSCQEAHCRNHIKCVSDPRYAASSPSTRILLLHFLIQAASSFHIPVALETLSSHFLNNTHFIISHKRSLSTSGTPRVDTDNSSPVAWLQLLHLPPAARVQEEHVARPRVKDELKEFQAQRTKGSKMWRW